MRLEMEIEITSFRSSGWSNIFHCGNGDQERYPAISISSSGEGFDVRFSDHDNWNSGWNTKATTTNKWYYLMVDITQSTFTVTVIGRMIGEEKHNVSKSRHDTFDNVVCYLSNPWSDAADVLVMNLKYYSLKGLCIFTPMIH